MDEGNEIANSVLDDEAPSGFYRVMQVVLRLLVVIIVGAGIGVGAYVGVPALYREFVEPVQENTRRITDLEAALTLEQDQTRRQAEQTGDRLDELETQFEQLGENFAGLQDEVDSLQTITSDIARGLEELQDVPDHVEDLTTEMQAMVTRLESFETSLSEIEIPAQRLERQMELLRAMTLLTRARLWLVQDNLGTAAEDVQDARDILSTLVVEDAEEESLEIQQIIDRLDMALEDIRSAPVVAADELEIAWKLLVSASAAPEEQVLLDGESIVEEDTEDESQ
jgi:predicted RNase H-like nuclease (RuvC/YqgF family)